MCTLTSSRQNLHVLLAHAIQKEKKSWGEAVSLKVMGLYQQLTRKERSLKNFPVMRRSI